MNVLYIIPARGGSKGVVYKNLKLLNGKPLIQYSIEAAMRSKHQGRIVVSTEDTQIAQVALSLGAEVPFIRPSELATDEAKSIDVVLHTIEFFELKNEMFEVVVLLQPTSPLRTSYDIDQSIDKLLMQSTVQSVVSVCKAEHSPLWTNTLPENLSMENFLRPELKNTNRQNIPKYYRLNGALYTCKTNYLKTNRTFIGNNTVAYIMPQERSVDIDTIIDFYLAETLLKEMQEHK